MRRETCMARRGAALIAVTLALGTLAAPRLAWAQDTSAPRQGAVPTPPPQTPSAPMAGRAAPADGGLHRRITIDVQHVPLANALLAIAQRAGVGLMQADEIAADTTTVTLHLTDVEARRAFDEALRGTGYIAREKAGVVVIVRAPRRTAVDTATGIVFGRVTDSSTAQPIQDAVVTVRGTKLQAATNKDGLYLLRDVPVGVQMVLVRHLGYMLNGREVAVVEGERVRADFGLKMGMTRLQEVVTTATGNRRRLEIANDITTIQVDSVLQAAPIRDVTDLLETRVPGLTVQHTSGAPGDPSRLRLRGAGSVYESNDPIVIIDGVRAYYSQSDARGGNLADHGNASGHAFAYAAPSPLDQLDVNSIEKIEVLKGPSAATLYGADAANGVIVVTTKRGRPGPTRWHATMSRGLSYLPGRYPDAYLRFGRDYDGSLLLCPLGSYCGAGLDSLVRFQALNTSDLTILSHGAITQVSLGVDGGAQGLTYSFTGSIDDETGILKLPGYSVQAYETAHGTTPPEWMRRPQSLGRWNGAGRVTAQLGPAATFSVTSMLTRATQQRSSLEQQLTSLMSTYVDRASGMYYQVQGSSPYPAVTETLVPDFYRRVTDAATNFTTAATVSWQPRAWLTASVDGGLNVIARRDENLVPRDMLDTLGSLSTARGSSIVSTVNGRALATKQLPWGFRMQFATGANYTKTSIADLATRVIGLAEGTTGVNGAAEVDPPLETVSDFANVGWYVEPSLAHKRFFLSAGLRFDGGSTYGSHVKLPTFPKLGGSWLISDEPWFPFKSVVNTLRLRAAYGHAGVQPGITDRLRLFGSSYTYSFVNGGSAQEYTMWNLGNTKLRAERSTEIEGGVDADLLDDRVSVSFSGYRKLRKDALLQVPVAPSVYGGGVSIWQNIGVIRNTGLEATVSTQLVRTAPVTWSWTLGMSRNKNVVVSLAPGMSPFNIGSSSTFGSISRIAPGYSLFGRWAKPILGYEDVNGNRIIEADEVQVGDSVVFMGDAAPNYEASLHTTLSLLRGALTIDAGFDYQDGLTQVNMTAFNNRLLSRAANDSTAPFGQQAAVAVMTETAYGLIQTVNTLRFNSLSVAFNAPPSLARRLGTSALSIALQGSNLGLFTNYAGKDPNVNAYATSNGVADTGVLPQPRSWRLTVSARY